MPAIDWTADQAEEVRQLILDRIEYLTESEGALRPNDAYDMRFVRQLLGDMRDLLRKLETAYDPEVLMKGPDTETVGALFTALAGMSPESLALLRQSFAAGYERAVGVLKSAESARSGEEAT